MSSILLHSFAQHQNVGIEERSLYHLSDYFVRAAQLEIAQPTLEALRHHSTL